MSGSLPDGFVLAPEQPAPAAIPDGFVLDPGHPVAGPSGDLLTDAGRRLGTAGATALGGFLALPNTVAQGVDWLGRKVGYDLGAQKAVGGVQEPDGRPLFPDANTARNMAFNTLGATEYAPQTMAGRIGQAALTGAVGGIANPASIPAMAAGGGTSELAGELFPDSALARIGGFILGSRGAGSVANAASRGVNAIRGAGQNATYQAYQRLGLPTELTGDVTGNPAMQFWQTFAAKMPGAESRIADARTNAVGAWNNALEGVAQNLGNATTPQEAGQSLQSAAKSWVNNFKLQSGANWNAFRGVVPENTPVDVSNFSDALADLTNRYGGANALASVLQPALGDKLRTALATDAPNGALPWQGVQAVRSALGERLENAHTIEGADLAAVKQLYGALSDDMRTGAYNVSPRAGQLFDLANAYTRTSHNLLDSHINDILTANTPEQAAQAALRGAQQGGTRLEALAQNLPGGVGDLAAAQARTAAGAGSPTAFASSVLGSGAKRPALSPEAAQVLYGPQQQAIGDLATTGRAMANTERMANHSNTATTEARGLGRIYTAIEMAKEGREMMGLPGGVAGFAAGMAAPSILGRIAGGVALNPALSRLYSTMPVVPFSTPGIAQSLPIAGNPVGLPTGR